jgi:oligopeptide transport system substrate-binding protein
LRGQSLLTPDPLTLQIKLSAPSGYFLAALTHPSAWAVPEKLIERYTQSTAVPDDRGPFVLTTWTQHLTDDGGFGGNLFKLTLWSHPESARATPVPIAPGTTVDPTVGVRPTVGADGRAHLALERNERFWGRKPLLRRIENTLYEPNHFWDYTGVADNAWADFAAGEGDLSQAPLKHVDAAKHMKDATFQQAPLLDIVYVTPNWRIAPFDDARVRQAFSLALDRRALARQVYQDTVTPSIHLVPDGMPGYNSGSRRRRPPNRTRCVGS